jgi:hypothetical protein
VEDLILHYDEHRLDLAPTELASVEPMIEKLMDTTCEIPTRRVSEDSLVAYLAYASR